MSSPAHVVAHEPWAVVDLDLRRGHIFVRQDWQYRFRMQMIMRPWTELEQRRFHAEVDRQIWRFWSHRPRFFIGARSGGKVSALAPPLLKACGGRGLTVSFDVRRVHGPGHWQVNVLRVSANAEKRASVDMVARAITLFMEDTAPSEAQNDAGKQTSNFMTIPHEFGHTLDALDEYNLGEAHLRDTNSVMNIGRQVRARHFRLLEKTLERMVPGCDFRPSV